MARPIKRGKLRLTRRAVALWQAGASVGEVSKCLKCPKARVMKILAPLEREEVQHD